MPGIKKILSEFFLGAKLFAKIQRKEHGTTNVIVQGHPNQFPATLEFLRGMLMAYYDSTIVWGETYAVATENRFNSVTIEDTLPILKRDPSSGEFCEKDLEEISFGGSATTENVKKIANQTFKSMVDGVRGIGIARGWIPETKKEHISVKLGDKRIHLEISSISSTESLLSVIGKKYEIAAPIKTIYRLQDNDIVLVTDVKGLREGFLYCALTINEDLPKNVSLE
jgi:hypothetical protein